MLVILISALLVRIAGWNTSWTAPYYFAHVTPLYVDNISKNQSLFNKLKELSLNTQAAWVHESLFVYPLHQLIYWLFGYSLQYVVLIGAFWGLLSVVCTWIIGRTLYSPAFGIIAASLMAASPLQIAWSRIGGIYIAGISHICITIAIAVLAGRTKSIKLALFAGLLAWCSFYHYLLGRIAIPLALAGLIQGLWKSCSLDQSKFTKKKSSFFSIVIAYFVGLISPLITIFLLCGNSLTLWPLYKGYLGNRDEHSIFDWIYNAQDLIHDNLKSALSTYYLSGRIDWTSQYFAFGASHGGLAFAPISILAILGFFFVFRHPFRHLLVFSTLILGLAIPLFSIPTARRFLAFDLANLLSATLLLLEITKLKAICIRRILLARILFLFAIVSICTWSIMVIYSLTQVIPKGIHPIPFGNGPFNDGQTCLRCLDAAKEWQKSIENGDLIFLVDRDIVREVPNYPGGLLAYGQIAALSAKRPNLFIDLFTLILNRRNIPPFDQFQKEPFEWIEYLKNLIDQEKPRNIVFHFERRFAWDTQFANNLIKLGGTVKEFKTPFSPEGGLSISFTKKDYAAILNLISEISPNITRPSHLSRMCLTFEPVKQIPLMSEAHVIAPYRENNDQQSNWAIATQNSLILKDKVLPIWNIKSISQEIDFGESNFIRLTTNPNIELVVNLQDNLTNGKILSNSVEAENCMRRIDGNWWKIDPERGSLQILKDLQTPSWIPNQKWIAIEGNKDWLLLGSADNNIWLFNRENHKLTTKVSMPLWQKPKWLGHPCGTLFLGSNWFGAINQFNSQIYFFGFDGSHLGTVTPLYLEGEVTAIAASENQIALATSSTNTFHVFKVEFADRTSEDNCENLDLENPTEGIYLSDVKAYKINQGYGRPSSNKTAGGMPLQLGGVIYANGIGTHSNAKLDFKLYKKYSMFSGIFGLPDYLSKGSVSLTIRSDSKDLWTSAVIRGGDHPVHFEVPVKDAQTLELLIGDGGDGIEYDHATLVDLRLSR